MSSFLGIFGNIIYIVAIELNSRKQLRSKLLKIFFILTFVSIVISIIFYFIDLNHGYMLEISVGFSVLSFFCLIIIINSYSTATTNKVSVTGKLIKLADERARIESKLEKSGSRTVQEIIRLNLNQLDEYYTINKSQSKNSYSFSIFMITIGLVLIASALVIFFVSPGSYSITLIVGSFGLISEFIGATSLSLYKESNKHLHEFARQLTYLQRVMLAIDLIEKVSENKKDEQISSIISGLMYFDKNDNRAKEII